MPNVYSEMAGPSAQVKEPHWQPPPRAVESELCAEQVAQNTAHEESGSRSRVRVGPRAHQACHTIDRGEALYPVDQFDCRKHQQRRFAILRETQLTVTAKGTRRVKREHQRNMPRSGQRRVVSKASEQVNRIAIRQRSGRRAFATTHLDRKRLKRENPTKHWDRIATVRLGACDSQRVVKKAKVAPIEEALPDPIPRLL
jgi:hypothetical protein